MNRRMLLQLGLGLSLGSCAFAAEGTSKYFVGGGSGAQGGLHLYKIDSLGKMTELSVTGKGENHSFQCLHKGVLYSCLSIGKGKLAKALVKAYRFDKKAEKLLEISQASTEARLCHLDASGHLLVGSSYGNAYLEVFELASDGVIKKSQEIFRFEGGSVRPDRQKSPHPHCFKFDPQGKYGFMPDLGRDVVEAFQVIDGRLKKRVDLSVKTAGGAGPRHFTFHPDQKRAYLINELNFTISAFNYDEGQLTETQTVYTLPKDFKEWNSCADIHVHSSGKYLYGSNRGHNSLVIFKINGEKLELIGHESTGGNFPRNFGIFDDFALVANQKSNDIQYFSLNV